METLITQIIPIVMHTTLFTMIGVMSLVAVIAYGDDVIKEIKGFVGK